VSGKKKDGIIFRAIPDSGSVMMRPDGKGFVTPIWPNCVVMQQKQFMELQNKSVTIWFPAPSFIQLPSMSWCVNICADADEYDFALNWLEQRLKEWGTPHVFNHPASIKQTRRDTVTSVLSGIVDLHVPKCVRILPTHVNDFAEAVEREDLTYPVLVRMARSQGGQNLAKIENAQDWDKVYALPWGGSYVYLSQFVDFRGEQGDYTKIRLTMVGGETIIRHAQFGEEWKVHHSGNDEEKVRRELALLEQLKSDARLNDIANEIGKRIPLDFWGIDLGYISQDEDFIFFEGNAAMSMLPRDRRRRQNTARQTSGNAMKAHIGESVSQKLESLLASPEKWAGLRRVKTVLDRIPG
jgi:glutathione synthase/RimK-type ligase-like ATP-grasp enzyme